MSRERKVKMEFKGAWDDYDDFIDLDDSFTSITGDQSKSKRNCKLKGVDDKSRGVTDCKKYGKNDKLTKRTVHLSQSQSPKKTKEVRCNATKNCENDTDLNESGSADFGKHENSEIKDVKKEKIVDLFGSDSSNDSLENPRPLGIDDSLSSLISHGETLLKNVSSIKSAEETMNAKTALQKLNNSILQKVFEAFEAIPTHLLKKLPGFDVFYYDKIIEISAKVNIELSWLDNISSRKENDQNLTECRKYDSSFRKVVNQDYLGKSSLSPNERATSTTQTALSNCDEKFPSEIPESATKSDSTNNAAPLQHFSLAKDQIAIASDKNSNFRRLPLESALVKEQNEHSQLNKDLQSSQLSEKKYTNSKISTAHYSVSNSNMSGNVPNNLSNILGSTSNSDNEGNISNIESTPPLCMEIDTVMNITPKTGSSKFVFKRPSSIGKNAIQENKGSPPVSKLSENIMSPRQLICTSEPSSSSTPSSTNCSSKSTAFAELPSKSLVPKLATPLFKRTVTSEKNTLNTTQSSSENKYENNKQTKAINNFLLEDDIEYLECLEDYTIEPASPEKNLMNKSENFSRNISSNTEKKSVIGRQDVSATTYACDNNLSELENNTSDILSSSTDESNYIGKFSSNTKNDGTSGEFNGTNFPHSEEMLKVFRKVFGLHSFRPCQLQAINAILLNHDSFILMPTGGGKSLCYQLPAVLSSGVTIVVSPLISLILDQVQKLNALDIPAGRLSGDAQEENDIYIRLSMREPKLKLLYVTPEKLISSSRCIEAIQSLYARGKIARIVIDEAHCVSQWGHDFRPDYKRLNELRRKYPDIAIVALTATATERVRIDILHQLGMKQTKWFICSFNRPNLQYEVVEKKSKTVVCDIISLIKSKFSRDCGIIYCLSQKECETTTNSLNKVGIKAGTYHAGLRDTERARVQNMWICNKIKVVCATIAFGMGIDKPDVRYVIHLSMPKSVEGLYQESGRAGRDGKPAKCILFYNYGDSFRLRRLIESGASVSGRNRGGTSSGADVLNTHLENLARIVAYCENNMECRRVQQLSYFGEIYDKKECLKQQNTTCDNCLRSDDFQEIDYTNESIQIVRCINQLISGGRWNDRNITILYLADIIKGSQASKIKLAGHDSIPIHGLGKSWPREDITNLIRQLVLKGYLCEELVITKADMAAAYLRIGQKAKYLLDNKHKVKLFTRKRTSDVNSTGKTPLVSENPFTEELRSIQEKCYADLMDVCHGIAASLGVGPSSVMNVEAIKAMSERLPESSEEMLEIPHVTVANFEKFGKPLLEVTVQYAVQKLVVLAEQAEAENQNNVNNGISESDGENEGGDYGEVSGSTGSFVPSKYHNGNKRKRKGSSQRGRPAKRGRGRGRGRGRSRGGKSKQRSNTRTYNGSSSTSGTSFSSSGTSHANPGYKPGSSGGTKRPGFLTLSTSKTLPPTKRPSFLPTPTVVKL